MNGDVGRCSHDITEEKMKFEIIRTRKSRVEYHLRKRSDRPTLVFLHGLGANQEQFINQGEFFSQNYQVVTLNVRGHGNSSSSEDFSLAGCAHDVIDVLDALKIQQFHFVGNSMGGNIGYELLSTFEDRLLSLTTYGTTGELNTPKSTTNILIFAYKLIPTSIIASLASSVGQTKESKRLIKAMMGKMKKATLLEIVPVLARFNYLSVISRSNTPFMIIRGAKDTEINKALPSTLAAFEERGNFILVDLEDVGHFANLDDPERFNSVLLEFLWGLDNANGA